MFSRILVPLDTSRRSQQALPQAQAIALKFGAEVVLLRVLRIYQPQLLSQSADEVSPVDFPTLEEREREASRKYLEEHRASLEAAGVKASLAVERGDPAQEIIEFVERQGIDLVVMCSHGRTGLARWMYGSVAEKVLHYVDCPLLLVRIQKDDLKAGEPK